MRKNHFQRRFHAAEFRRVFSTIGTYVGLQGADVYPRLIRKYEPKGLRVFLQDGDHDQNIYGCSCLGERTPFGRYLDHTYFAYSVAQASAKMSKFRKSPPAIVAAAPWSGSLITKGTISS